MKRDNWEWEGGGEGRAQRILRPWKYPVWCYKDGNVSLHICPNSQSIQHQEWTWKLTKDFVMTVCGGRLALGKKKKKKSTIRVKGKTLDLPLSFTVNLKLLLKKSLL